MINDRLFNCKMNYLNNPVFKAEMYITRMVAKAPKSTNDSRLKKILRLEMSNFIHSEAFMVSRFQKRLVL